MKKNRYEDNNMDTQSGFLLDSDKGYFKCAGVDVMAFDDIYPAGHQSGVSMIMHAKRVLTNGDLRLEKTVNGSRCPGSSAGRRILSATKSSHTWPIPTKTIIFAVSIR